ncbi:MAG: hypothetical protein E7365_04585 [Clostridiales bacterium]|nr:hypothetical protein [Clostridiales bacterium]
MEALSSYIGIDVYCQGKIIGRITDFLINITQKDIGGITCIGNSGIIRNKFYVDKSGIKHLDRNGAVIDKDKIRYKRFFYEEYAQSGFGIYKDKDYFAGSVGDIYFDPVKLKIDSVSVKKGFIDDMIYGRDIVDIKNISMTEKGLIIINRE